MMRNVALGAVIGFGVMVLLLSLLGRDAPPRLPPEPAPAIPDAGAPPRPPPAAPAPVAASDAGPVAVAPVLAPFNAPLIRTPLRLNGGQLELARAHQRMLQQPVVRAPDAGP